MFGFLDNIRLRGLCAYIRRHLRDFAIYAVCFLMDFAVGGVCLRSLHFNVFWIRIQFISKTQNSDKYELSKILAYSAVHSFKMHFKA